MYRRTLLCTAALLGLCAGLGVVAAQAADPKAALAELANTILVKDVNGVAAQPISVVKLSDDELAKIKGMNATAALVMHYGGNDWSRAQIQALQTQFAAMGIKVIAVTDAGFKAEKQVSDIETVLAQKPRHHRLGPGRPGGHGRRLQGGGGQRGENRVHGLCPEGSRRRQGLCQRVSADDYGNGVASAHLMAEALGGKGDIGLVFHAADFYVTRQRYEAVKATIAKDYPDIKIVGRAGHRRSRLPGRRRQGGIRHADRQSQHQGYLGRLGRAGARA